MGRVLMYFSLGVLALFVVATYTVVEHGGGSIGAVRQLSVHDLTSAAPAYDGASVSTTGRLSYSNDEGHYELVDEANYGVVIRGYADESALAPLIGEWVTVTGVFGWERELGTFIDASSIHAASNPFVPETD